MSEPLTVAAVRRVLARHQRTPFSLQVDRELKPASVLVPIIDAPAVHGGPRLILTRRPDEMRTHSGQIAFPGGRRDPEDASEIACALREAEEELGIPARAVEVLGALDDTASPFGYVVTAVVGLVAPETRLLPNEREVAEVFDVKLSDLIRHDVFQDLGEREFLGVRQRLSAYQVGERRIWGLTARLIQNLLELLGYEAQPVGPN